MKKKSARKTVSHKKYTRGALGAGMAYVILAMLILVAAGTTMIGSIVPTGKGEYGMPVVIMTHSPDGRKNNLQLETFPGATYTPTPTPTATPTPTTPPPPPGGGDGGGNSAPDRRSAPAGDDIGYAPIQSDQSLIA
jgi:hypothetical protein